MTTKRKECAFKMKERAALVMERADKLIDSYEYYGNPFESSCETYPEEYTRETAERFQAYQDYISNFEERFEECYSIDEYGIRTFRQSSNLKANEIDYLNGNLMLEDLLSNNY